MKKGEVSWQSFREGKFRHDCVSIELTKNDATSVTYRGTGEVWQDEFGTLSFKCISRDDTQRAVESILTSAALAPGKLIPEEAYYSIQLTTFDNATWHAENVWVEMRCSFVTGYTVIVGKLRTLRSARAANLTSRSNSMELLILNQNHKDWNSLTDTVAHLEQLGCDIKFLMQRDSDVLVEITGNAPLPKNFEVRIVEALRYVLASILHLSLIVKNTDGVREVTLISPVRQSDTRLVPPLATLKPSPDVAVLFERYLSYVHEGASADFVHPCSMYLRNACEASANSVEASAIGLCVAVEGLANLLPYDAGKESNDQTIAVVQKELLKRLAEIGVTPNVKSRVEGLLGQLKSIRAADRLQLLVKAGKLDQSCFSAWKKLRNTGVHPTKTKLEELDDSQLLEFLDRIYQVYVCMYQITFALIGYEGTFSNYALSRFPAATYPLPAAPGGITT
ncbi:hypothetical protein V1294_004334 [Bradyrhizobium sp. AZCC 1678]|uniref:hypothetical protein n=1 Tax=Bradyrhizobium sp. AZCC 1678 TaxID=3117030 RepID=UPI002FF052AF